MGINALLAGLVFDDYKRVGNQPPPTHTHQLVMTACACILTLQVLLGEHGMVCISRAGADDVASLLEEPGSVLARYRYNIMLVEEPVPNDISSSKVGI
jgi:hypothetical protein